MIPFLCRRLSLRSCGGSIICTWIIRSLVAVCCAIFCVAVGRDLVITLMRRMGIGHLLDRFCFLLCSCRQWSNRHAPLGGRVVMVSVSLRGGLQAQSTTANLLIRNNACVNSRHVLTDPSELRS